MELKKFIILFVLPVVLILASAFEEKKSIGPNSNVYDVLLSLGDSKVEHEIESPDENLIETGRLLVHTGKAPGSKYISKYFVCTSCHNTVREDPVLTDFDPEGRLKYAQENQIPFLQGSTFWGIVNRESWYNDDYVKKYGDLVVKANKSLEESIQLCATVCSAGRGLNDDEMKAILAYLWSLQIKIEDIELSEDEIRQINASLNKNSSDEAAIAMLKSKYALKSPATFVDAPTDKLKGYEYEGDPESGKLVFELSCKQCHRVNGESDVDFEDSKKTFKWFRRNIDDNGRLSIYNIIRYGTYSERSHPEYMPHYTRERMSDQQVEDLRELISN